jgi:hypothetical protein
VTPEAVAADPDAPARVPAGWSDLRRPPSDALVDQVIARVEAALRVRMDRGALLRKRRTVSARSDRGTWVRIEARSVDRVISQGWAGVEASGALTGVAKPAWHQAVSWTDPDQGVWWRADETELITAAPVKLGGTITVTPQLPATWWTTLRESLTALAGQPTARVAKLHSATASQAYIGSLVDKATDEARVAVDSTITEWTTAHADLTWANLTAPACWLLDWEDWGTAPRGLDAATLLVGSLAVPTLAGRIRREFADDLGSRSGQLVTLALCAELTSYPDYAGVLYESARQEARALLDALNS